MQFTYMQYNTHHIQEVPRLGTLYHLVANVQQGPHSQSEGEALVMTHKVAHIFQQKVAGPVQVAEAQIRHHLS